MSNYDDSDSIWLRDAVDAYYAENEKLRDYAYALEECRREAHYCEFCPHFSWDFDGDVQHCDFDFDALRAAAGMEVDE